MMLLVLDLVLQVRKSYTTKITTVKHYKYAQQCLNMEFKFDFEKWFKLTVLITFTLILC